MKKRRTLIISLLLVAALCLGVGYAALTDILDIAGTIDLSREEAEKEFNLDIMFDEQVIVSDPTLATARRNTDNDDKGTFSVTGFKAVDDEVTITYKILNIGELDAQVTPKVITNTYAENLSYTTDWDKVGGGMETKTIVAGGEQTISITVKLTQLPTETIQANFNLELSVVADEA